MPLLLSHILPLLQRGVFPMGDSPPQTFPTWVLTNCSRVDLYPGVQSFRNRLFQHGPPTRSQVLPVNLSSVDSCLHGSTGPARSTGCPWGHSLLWISTGLWSSMGCRWRSVPLWTSMGCSGTTCLTMVLSTGCRGICAPAPGGPPPPPPSSLILVPAELFLSHVLTPLFSSCN